MKRWAVTSFVFAVASIAPWQSACAELPYQLAWARQFGTSGVDYGFFTAVDYAGNVLVVGGTEGSLGAPNAGETDVFLTKYDPAGNLQWMKQFGSQGNEFTEGMTVDPLGNVYITGFTYGSLGGPQIGNGDAFLTKFDQSGNLLWSKQVGTTSADGGEGIAIDPGGNVILTGFTFGALNGPNAGSADGFLRKYDGLGNILWAKQFGTPRSDSGSDVVADSFGNVLVAGEQQVSGVGLDFSKYDASLWKFDGDGNQLWQRQFGTDYLDAAIDIALDPSGNAVILGSTNRSNAVSNRPSQFDAFV